MDPKDTGAWRAAVLQDVQNLAGGGDAIAQIAQGILKDMRREHERAQESGEEWARACPGDQDGVRAYVEYHSRHSTYSDEVFMLCVSLAKNVTTTIIEARDPSVEFCRTIDAMDMLPEGHACRKACACLHVAVLNTACKNTLDKEEGGRPNHFDVIHASEDATGTLEGAGLEVCILCGPASLKAR